MKTTLKLEEFLMLLLGIFFFSILNLSWWWFLAFFLAPDLGMIGYAFGNKTGAAVYNLCHHKGVAITLGVIGYFLNDQILMVTGIILFSHASFDRVLGYGLKYDKGFKYTHLGEIGNKKAVSN